MLAGTDHSEKIFNGLLKFLPGDLWFMTKNFIEKICTTAQVLSPHCTYCSTYVNKRTPKLGQRHLTIRIFAKHKLCHLSTASAMPAWVSIFFWAVCKAAELDPVGHDELQSGPEWSRVLQSAPECSRGFRAFQSTPYNYTIWCVYKATNDSFILLLIDGAAAEVKQ